MYSHHRNLCTDCLVEGTLLFYSRQTARPQGHRSYINIGSNRRTNVRWSSFTAVRQAYRCVSSGNFVLVFIPLMGRNCPSTDTITSTSKTHVFTATTSGGYLYRAVHRFSPLVDHTHSKLSPGSSWIMSPYPPVVRSLRRRHGMLSRTDPDVQYIVFYFYECCIAFTEEVSVIWRRKWTGMTLLFAFTRYIALFLQILSFMPNPTYIVSPLPYCSVCMENNTVIILRGRAPVEHANLQNKAHLIVLLLIAALPLQSLTRR